MSEPIPGALIVFPVSGDWRSYEAPDMDGDVNTPAKQGPQAFITFTARLPAGLTVPVAAHDIDGALYPTGILLPPVTVRMWAGTLRTINKPNTRDVCLLANDPALNLADILAALPEPHADTLIYDVAFTNVTYNDGKSHKIVNFAFEAPADATPVCLTDPDLPKLGYKDPLP